MTSLTLPLAAVQAGLLLWAAVHLSNAVMRPKKLGPLLWALVTLAGPLAIAHYAIAYDRHRVVCGLADCLILSLSVAGIRVFAVSKEEEKLAAEHAESRRRAAEAAEAARQARKAEELKAAAAALESRMAQAEKKAADPAAPRHLTPSLLRGGAPSPRLPPAPRKK
ncbi:MAG: hypothetical protein NTV51_08030 [Verrucomicrobia bacterium]|nr:hypothetical protein [Verrucomicrobiota bacterium]